MRIQENYWVIAQICKPFTRMLVFEYASNGTLYEHLHYGEGCQLSSTRRMKIVIGIAQGLRYLHTQLDPPFTISELNSSVVYLTEDFSPKVSQSLEHCSVFNILLLFMHLKRMSWSC